MAVAAGLSTWVRHSRRERGRDIPGLTSRIQAEQGVALVGLGERATAHGLAEGGRIASPFGLAALVTGVVLASHTCGGWDGQDGRWVAEQECQDDMGGK